MRDCEETALPSEVCLALYCFVPASKHSGRLENVNSNTHGAKASAHLPRN